MSRGSVPEVMNIQTLIMGVHLARSTRGRPCAPPLA